MDGKREEQIQDEQPIATGVEDLTRLQMIEKYSIIMREKEAKRILNLSPANSYVESMRTAGITVFQMPDLEYVRTLTDESAANILSASWIVDVFDCIRRELFKFHKHLTVKLNEENGLAMDAPITALTPPQFYNFFGNLWDFISVGCYAASEIITRTSETHKKAGGKLTFFMAYFSIQANLKKLARHGKAWHWFLKNNTKQENRTVLDSCMTALRTVKLGAFDILKIYDAAALPEEGETSTLSPAVEFYRTISIGDGMSAPKSMLDKLALQDSQMEKEEYKKGQERGKLMGGFNRK